ncbi:MAG: hypothetical protein ACK550_00560 [Synechococcaceae cyanobacterium]
MPDAINDHRIGLGRQLGQPRRGPPPLAKGAAAGADAKAQQSVLGLTSQEWRIGRIQTHRRGVHAVLSHQPGCLPDNGHRSSGGRIQGVDDPEQMVRHQR